MSRKNPWASRMNLKPFVIGLIVASALLRGGALAEDARRAATRIAANYGVYWVAAEHCAVSALSNFRTDGFREWFGGDAFVPGEP